MSGFGSSILIEAAPPRLPACLIRNAGWLYSGFVAVTSRTADADSSAPSLDVIEMVAIVFPLKLVCCEKFTVTRLSPYPLSPRAEGVQLFSEKVSSIPCKKAARSLRHESRDSISNDKKVGLGAPVEAAA